MTLPIIEIKQLKKVYGRGKKQTEALKGISLSLQEGEVCGFIGRNGAGKSTTIRILTGLTTPTSGTVHLFGEEPSNPTSRMQLGYCPENPYLIDTLTPLEWMQISGARRSLKGQQLKSICMELLEKLEISHVANKPIRQFSKGMTQRVALANALIGSPKLLILDEPLSGLDPLGRFTVVSLLREYASQGGSIFFSSHILSDVAKLADRITLINQGMIVDTPEALKPGQSQQFEITYASATALFEGDTKLDDHVWKSVVPSDSINLAITKLSQHQATVRDLQVKHLELDEIFVELLCESTEVSK